MGLLIILCAFLLGASVASDDFKVFRKCCPKDQSLLKVTGSDDMVTIKNYDCIESDFDLSDNKVENPSLHLFVDPSVIIDNGVPDECELQTIPLSDINLQLSTSRDVCYDRLAIELINGTLQKLIPKTVALKCNYTELSPETKLEIENIRKCCPRGQVYDTEYHLCRKNDEGSNEEWLLAQLKRNRADIYEFENGLYCKLDEYAVELKEGQFSFALHESSLSVLKKNGKDTNLMPKGNWCVDREYSTRQLVARVCTRDCGDFDAFCMRKCCPVGQHFRPKRCGSPASICVPNTDDSILFNISSYMNPLTSEYGIGDIMGIRSEMYCKDGKISLNATDAVDHHTLTSDGRLKTRMGMTNDYCLEFFDTRFCNGQVYVTAVMCFIKSPIVKDFRLSFVLNCISATCLALTLLVYCFIPELRNLHGLNLICHGSTMLLAYSCLARVQYKMVVDGNLCTVLGYGIYFGFVASFAWLNVMCLDIWWTFGGIQKVQKALHKGGVRRKKFFWYSLYAWGISVSLTLTTYLLDKFPVSPILDADMGHGNCWFGSLQNTESDWPHYIFFVIPMGVVSAVNFVLWVLTARHCARVKSEVHRLQAGSVGDRAKRRFRVDKANLTLTGKLWVVMGAGWISELISTVFAKPDMPWIFVPIDMVNELQGVFIFIILVFKPKLYYLIRKRLGLEKPDARKNGASSSGRTSSTFLSRTISSDERTMKRVSVSNDNAKIQ